MHQLCGQVLLMSVWLVRQTQCQNGILNMFTINIERFSLHFYLLIYLFFTSDITRSMTVRLQLKATKKEIKMKMLSQMANKKLTYNADNATYNN
jgi:PDZ domain-containing secreted protein